MKKKGLFICFLLVFIGCFCVFGVGLKARAASDYYQVNVDSADVVVYFSLPSFNNDYLLVYGDNNQDTILLTYDENNDYYIVNNNPQNILLKNYVYALKYQNTVNHYIFYIIEFGDNVSSVNDLTITQLFTVSFSTRTINYFNIYSVNIQFMFNSSVSATPQIILSNFFYFYSNTAYFNMYKNNYNLGYNRGYSTGYNEGYDGGYDDGQTGENAISPIWNLFQGIFRTIGAIFTIELAPHVYIGYFFLVPLFFGVVGLILWIWRRN